MTRFNLKIGRAEFSFGLAPLLLVGAGLAASLLLLAYIDALHGSMRQGEAFRKLQHSSDASAVAFKPGTSSAGHSQRATVLVSK
ncbi:MAG: hypothetical protein ABI671_01440 [Burkholderiales bacterium]